MPFLAHTQKHTNRNGRRSVRVPAHNDTAAVEMRADNERNTEQGLGKCMIGFNHF